MSEGQHFCGILGGVVENDETLIARFYPWTFTAYPDETPVFQIAMVRPAFDPGVLKAFEREELDVEVFPDRITIQSSPDHEPTTLVAADIVVSWERYTSGDLCERITLLDELLRQSDAAFSGARRRIEATQTLIAELIRRADIKAEASPDLEAREAAVKSILQRVLARLNEV